MPNRYNSINRNVVEDSGAEGIFQSGVGNEIQGNVVLRSGGDGIRAGRISFSTKDNVVLYSSGAGMAFAATNAISGNVARRNDGPGIQIDDSNGLRSVRNNTAYLNNGPGFQVGTAKAWPDSITNNISYGNSVGLAWSGVGTPHLACNDWLANTGGAVTGLAPGATDVSLDPRFCDLPNDIVSLASDSPLASLAGCGQVGALGVRCAAAVGVGDPRPASLGRLTIRPQPSRGAMRFAWSPVEAATSLEVYDVTGARRLVRTIAPGTSEYAWNGTDDAGDSLPAGVYFAKIVQGHSRSESTVVVIR